MTTKHLIDATDLTRHVPVSVIVPCYQAERFLERALDSLIAQTLPGIEIICVNDGSTDATPTLLHSYQSRYPERIVVLDKDNEGTWLGRLDAIDIARGDYIGFLDSDDYAQPMFCETLYRTATTHNADIAVCGYRRVDERTGHEYSREMTVDRTPFRLDTDPARFLELNGAPWNKLFRAGLIKQLDRLDDIPSVFDDIALLLLLARKTDRVAFAPDAVVDYFVRGGSTFSSLKQEQIDRVYRTFTLIRDRYAADDAPLDLRALLDAAAFLHLGISLSVRVSRIPGADLGTFLTENEDFLDRHFPTWRTDRIISQRNARKYGGSFGRILWARRAYEHHLMKPALAGYRAMIDVVGKDIKW